MSQAPLRLPQRDRRGDARFGTKSRVCNRTDGAPSRIDYQSTLMPTGAHSFKKKKRAARKLIISRHGRGGKKKNKRHGSFKELECHFPVFLRNYHVG